MKPDQFDLVTLLNNQNVEAGRVDFHWEFVIE